MNMDDIFPFSDAFFNFFIKDLKLLSYKTSALFLKSFIKIFYIT